MRDEPARDAIERVTGRPVDTENARDAVCLAILQEARHGVNDSTLDVILAALGIPPDATTDDVRAGLARIEHPQISTTHRIDGTWEAWMPTFDGYGRGASPAAAVLALANKLEEQK